MSSHHLVNPDRFEQPSTPEKLVSPEIWEKECAKELADLQKAIEGIGFQELVTSRMAVLEQEFETIADRTHISRIAYTPLDYTPESCPVTPLRAAYGYGLCIDLPNEEVYFMALGYSLHVPYGEQEVPAHYLLLSPTHTPPGKQDIFGQLNPTAAYELERFREAQQTLHPKFIRRSRNILNQTLTGKNHQTHSESYSTTQEITAQLTTSPEYTSRTFGLGVSLKADKMQAEVALDHFLVNVLSSGKLT